jgi:Zn-dependent protease
MDINQIVQTVAIYALPVLFAITLHEAAHGYVARHFGDMTAYAQGRISLNPARHFDWLGTLVIPIVILVLSSGKFLFGWAKPVPVNYSALRSPRRHMLWVAAAGPASNLAMTIGWALLLKIALILPVNMFTEPMLEMSKAGIQVNLIFAFLNLLPILPLDGGRIVASLLPARVAWGYAKLEPWGFPILLGLMFMGALNVILAPMIAFSFSVLGTLFRI